MRGSMPARPAVLAIFLGWSLLASIRERLGARPATPRRAGPAPARDARAGSTESTEVRTKATEVRTNAPGRDARLWLN